MCELMGLSFDRPISADFSIRAFALRDMENAHGWGSAWYPDQSLAVVKEPLEWRQSSFTQFLENYHGLNSRLYVAHVRHQTTGGPPTRADTHPFSRELAAREFCFAQNGTLADFHELPLGRFRPLGGTDSEHLFCSLLEQLAQRNDLLNDEPSWHWLHQQLAELNRRGKLNCLLSDGHRLFGYHDAAGWKGLSLRKLRIAEGQARHLEDATVEIDMQNVEHQALNHGYVIATCPLSAAGWQSFFPGELIVLEGGTLCFSSHADRHIPRAGQTADRHGVNSLSLISVFNVIVVEESPAARLAFPRETHARSGVPTMRRHSRSPSLPEPRESWLETRREAWIAHSKPVVIRCFARRHVRRFDSEGTRSNPTRGKKLVRLPIPRCDQPLRERQRSFERGSPLASCQPVSAVLRV
ncbi:MAG: class II glutamine amidotransferase [Planctomycetaceae bacterium]